MQLKTLSALSGAAALCAALLSACAESGPAALIEDPAPAAEQAAPVSDAAAASADASAAGAEAAAAGDGAVSADDVSAGIVKALPEADAQELMEVDPAILNVPCPNGWSVRSNPSVDNSLSFLENEGKLAVSVTYIKQDAAGAVEAEAYARVAAEQLKCSIPVKSNLIEGGWSFQCADFKVEALVYGGLPDLVLLAISGRNESTESKLDEFIDFLADQAQN